MCRRPQTHVSGTPRAVTRVAKAFTYVEVMLATIVVGVAVPALLLLVGSTTKLNASSQQYTTALMLANQMHEMMSSLPFNDPLSGTHTGGPNAGEGLVGQYDDVQDFDGLSVSPPIDANRQGMDGMDNWRQSVAVQLLGNSQGKLLGSVTGDTAAIVERVRVTVSYRTPGGSQWVPVVTLSFLKTRY
jgi:type II secretory pathway pseudopilin PulG